MDSQLRQRAEVRLAEAAQALGLADPRPAYRDRLRELKKAEPAVFDRAVLHYENDVLPSIVESDPIPVWVEYGRYLASLTTDGSAVRIDEQGRATPWSAESAPGLALFIPADTASSVLVLCQPLELSDAQQATVRLLVDRKLS